MCELLESFIGFIDLFGEFLLYLCYAVIGIWLAGVISISLVGILIAIAFYLSR